MHEKLIEQAGELEAEIRAVKPQTVFVTAAANSVRGAITHLGDDAKAAETIAGEKAKAAEAKAKAEPATAPAPKK